MWSQLRYESAPEKKQNKTNHNKTKQQQQNKSSKQKFGLASKEKVRNFHRRCAGHPAPFTSVWHHLVDVHLLLLATTRFCGSTSAEVFGIQMCFIPVGWTLCGREDFSHSLFPGAFLCFVLTFLGDVGLYY